MLFTCTYRLASPNWNCLLSVRDTTALVYWTVLWVFLTSQTSFIVTDENECSALPCANRTSFIYAVIKEASELWTCTQGSDSLSELLFLCGGCLTQ